MGGVNLEQIAVGLGELQRVSQGSLEVLSLQELPRGEIGWSTMNVGPWQVVSHRCELEWRGSGVGFRSDSWCLLRKRQSSRGVWVKLRRLRDNAELWCGSVYLSQGASREVHAQEIHDFMKIMPATLLPVLVGGDANTLLKWSTQSGEKAVAVAPEAKGDYMLGVMQGEGLTLTPPCEAQWSTPTSRPRRDDARGRQIDFMACRRAESDHLQIHVNSYMYVGGDHEGITQVVTFKLGSKLQISRRSNRPREVVREPVIEGELDQHKLTTIARQCTRPRQGHPYRDPQHVKVMFQLARRSHTSEDWKRALRERKQARKLWMEEKIRAATKGDWGAYQETTKKGSTGWESHFAVHDHLQGVYGGSEPTSVPDFPFSTVERVPSFTPEELHDALQKGKNKKSVGSDQVPHELLRSIGATVEGQQKILAWFNRLLHGEESLPNEWSRASMILIPKVTLPTEPRQVRPICIGQAANKLFCRMLLERTKRALQYSGSSQSMGSGRQTNDYVFSITRLMQLEREWKWGLCFLKIDVEKAFDSLDRRRFLDRLSAKLGANEVLRCWWHMFSHTDAVLQTVWGESVVNMTTGIRQGSVESPQMFATVMDWILTDFQSDTIAVGNSRGLTCRRLPLLTISSRGTDRVRECRRGSMPWFTN